MPDPSPEDVELRARIAQLISGSTDRVEAAHQQVARARHGVARQRASIDEDRAMRRRGDAWARGQAKSGF